MTTFAAHEIAQGRLSVLVTCGDDLHRVSAALRGGAYAVSGLAGADPPAVVVCRPTAAAGGLAGLRQLRQQHPDTRILAIFPPDEHAGDLRRALRCGADGIVLDDGRFDAALPVAIEAVLLDQVVVPQRLHGTLTREALSHREKQILALMVRGCTNRQIAGRLYLAESTVKSHLSSAFTKLGTRSRAETAALILDADEGLAQAILTALPGEGLAGGAVAS